MKLDMLRNGIKPPDNLAIHLNRWSVTKNVTKHKYTVLHCTALYNTALHCTRTCTAWLMNGPITQLINAVRVFIDECVSHNHNVLVTDKY